MSNDVPVAAEALTTARQLLASALEMDSAEIPDDAGIDQLANWDSLAHMRLILALEEHMSATLSPRSIVAISGLMDIAAILEGKPLTSQGF